MKHVFITLGDAMHLNDASCLQKRTQHVCNSHEQASAMAAEGYARTAGKMAVACFTSGPGGTNTLSSRLGQRMDSTPVVCLSDQVRLETTIASTDLPVRQLGDQEANIIDIVPPITRHAGMVINPLLLMGLPISIIPEAFSMSGVASASRVLCARLHSTWPRRKLENSRSS